MRITVTSTSQTIPALLAVGSHKIKKEFRGVTRVKIQNLGTTDVEIGRGTQTLNGGSVLTAGNEDYFDFENLEEIEMIGSADTEVDILDL